MRSPDLTGKVFGRLTVIRYDGARPYKSDKKNRGWWLCKCECGNEMTTITNSLTSGHTKSCGCLQPQIVATNQLKHGNSRVGKRSPEHHAWVGMKQRCTNPKTTGYEDWGGRGIKVCDRWMDSFENFLADMGPRPSPLHSLDRYPDMNGNYEPGNCRWSTKYEQILNRRNTIWVEYKGETMCFAEFKRRIGIKSQWALVLLNRGQTPEQIEYHYKHNKKSHKYAKN